MSRLPSIQANQATDKLKTLLQGMPQPLCHLGDFLQKHQGVIAGSFIFPCVMNTQFFIPGDIDLFVPNTKKPEHQQELEACGWKYKPGPYYNVAYRVGTGAVNESQWSHPDCPLTINLVKYDLPNGVSVGDYIDAHFDLDGCTLRWDGKQWWVAPDVDLDAMIEKHHMRYRLAQVEERLKQFGPEEQQRYSDQHGVPVKQMKQDVKAFLLNRLRKYETRGFTIINASDVRTHPLLNE